MTAVKITGMVVTSQYGTLSAGDILRTSKEFAAHLVNDCRAAVYLDAHKASQGKDEAPDTGSVAPVVKVKTKRKG